MTQSLLYRNALFASISHAVMTNVFPDFSYEQSWDGRHYCFQDICSTTGVISFYSDDCICAVRNDEHPSLQVCQTLESMKDYLTNEKWNEFVHTTLQYMQCGPDPKHMNITAMILINASGIRHWRAEGSERNACEDMPPGLWGSEAQCKDFWRDYYDMDASVIHLISEIVEQRLMVQEEMVILSEQLTNQIPGNELCAECIQSFSELNIQIHR